jgi:epoxyqueuosine reductase
VPLRAFLAEDAAERKRRFHGTALGMSWIAADALLRNALVAAGNSGDASLRALVARHASAGSETVCRAAKWALQKLEITTRTADAALRASVAGYRDRGAP